jgi:tetratricopeptide (TPR) repeat protein/tRNA A-37 threonylcarbamoyl transferase component Bud32
MNDIRSRLEQALGGTHTFERELGGGGMSRTYLALETALQRRVVIKVLAPELLAGISVERFRREVLLAAQLQHPHVVPVLATGEVDGIPWFSMPYVEGDSLRQRLATGAVGIGEAVGTLRDVARALAYAHARGIVHRDIKPDNVLLSGGSATVTDFGIAKAINAARTDGGGEHETLTQIGTSIGTPAYMAPEQAAGDPSTDHRADLYAFGVMAYEMLAGRPPFVSATPTKLLAAHMSEAPRDLLEFRPDCPMPLRDMVMQCLAKEPTERPLGANELVRVLDTVTSSGAGAAVPAILRGGQIRLGRALAIWSVAAIAVVVTAWAAREVIGLPDWVLPGSIGVMLAGLPVLGFTAYAQRLTHRTFSATPHRTPAPQGTMQTLALRASPHLSWRRTWMGGALAVGGFALLVVGFMVLRALGIGPMASLQANGAFGANETVMIADFRSPASDSTLGATVAEALRTDLAQSRTLRVLSRGAITDQLRLMQRPLETSITFELAREVATREGAKAVLDGSIQQLGQSYVISARLVSAMDGSDLALFREEAASQDGLLPAIGKLAKAVRSKAGESLRLVRASSELERVTTPSLEALRKYVEGQRLADEAGETERGIAMIREAVTIDTSFAMAWRKLAALLSNQGQDTEAVITAAATAFRHRDRLTPMERLLTEGFYYTAGPEPDRAKAIAAYEEAVRLDSTSIAAINNVATLFTQMDRFEEAEAYFRRVVALPRPFGGGFTNLIQEQIRNHRSAASLDSTVALYRAALPENHDIWEVEWYAARGKGDLVAGDSIARRVQANPRTPRQEILSSQVLAGIARYQGKLGDMRRWWTRRNEVLMRVQPGPTSAIDVALSPIGFEAQFGDRQRALRMLEQQLARTPLTELPPSERPYGFLRNMAILLREPRLARQALDGFNRDQAGLTSDAVAVRADMAGAEAFAAGRWDEAIDSLRIAEQGFGITQREATALRGIAHMEAGRPDSAIASFERFFSLADPGLSADNVYGPDILTRLGELYEGKGNRGKAIDMYSQLVTRWADADPELQPRVRELRDRINRLRAEGG